MAKELIVQTPCRKAFEKHCEDRLIDLNNVTSELWVAWQAVWDLVRPDLIKEALYGCRDTAEMTVISGHQNPMDALRDIYLTANDGIERIESLGKEKQ